MLVAETSKIRQGEIYVTNSQTTIDVHLPLTPANQHAAIQTSVWDILLSLLVIRKIDLFFLRFQLNTIYLLVIDNQIMH